MKSDLTWLSAAEMSAGFQSGELSPVAVLESSLARIEALDGRLNAMAYVSPQTARNEAEASALRWKSGEPLGPLDGVPVAVKDLIPVAGMPLRYGSLASSDVPVGEDAPSVNHLRKGGAVIVGKTTTAEFGWKAVCRNALTGITRNPWNTECTPGGSSGGSAVAVTTGMVALALGGDEGGSIRVPSSFCGIAGLKPTWGRVPLHQPAYCGTWSHVGPMARTVGDLALAMNVLGKPDRRDWESLPDDGVDYRMALDAGAKGLRVAISPNLGFVTLDPVVEEAVCAAAAEFSQLGAQVCEATPEIGNPIDPYYILVRLAARALVDTVPGDQQALLVEELRKDAADADNHTAMDVKHAEMEQRRLGAVMNRFFETFDVLVTATVAVPAFGAADDDPSGKKRVGLGWTGTTYPFNFTRLPAISIPCGLSRGGLPIGLQIVGPRHGDAMVLRAARAYEAAVPGIGRPPID
jgi:aspartyl-tRNA(Asn)/glutamyl-tRNA(Gln) amidotransferase subunit A